MVKSVAFVLAEALIAALLIGLLFIALLFQPTWVWIAAPLVMLASFIGIAVYSKTNARAAWWIVFLSPLSYIVSLLFLFMSVNALPSPAWAAFAAVAAYYAGGVILLSGHLWLNAKLR
jgi:hypothetical protein